VNDGRQRIAIIGGGPRAISVLERLVIDVPKEKNLEVDVYDSVLPGAGRIWNPDQSSLLLMNTPAQEVTIFSGKSDEGAVRAGSGPSLREWLDQTEIIQRKKSDYVPRAVYGKYLRFAFEAIVSSSYPRFKINGFTDTVTSIKKDCCGFKLFACGAELGKYDAVVLATGHPSNFGSRDVDESSGRYISGDSAASLILESIDSSETVATIGMGLSFHDIVSLLTEGRGGRFEDTSEGLQYFPSGREPHIVGVSRSGMPILSRGFNQKPPSFSFNPTLCTVDRMASLRKPGGIDFKSELEPWILAEAQVTFITTILRASHGCNVEEEFRRLASKIEDDPLNQVVDLGKRYGVHDRLPSFDELTRPFDGMRFASISTWTSELTQYLQRDVFAAEEGNINNPIKAALDTLRDIRSSIRVVVNDGGLTPDSHERDFQQSFVPAYSLLVAGPPLRRNRELLALIDARIVTVAPPNSKINDSGPGKFRISSDLVPEDLFADRVIDARIPKLELGKHGPELYRNLLGEGIVRRYRHQGARTSIETDAIETDPITCCAVDCDGNLVRGMYVIGIPTEGQNWFTQIGNGRPGVISGFSEDARRLVHSMLENLNLVSL